MVLFPFPAFFGSVAGANRNVRPIVLLCELESFAWRQCRVRTEVLKTMPWNEVPNVEAKSLLSFASCVYIYSTHDILKRHRCLHVLGLCDIITRATWGDSPFELVGEAAFLVCLKQFF